MFVISVDHNIVLQNYIIKITCMLENDLLRTSLVIYLWTNVIHVPPI